MVIKKRKQATRKPAVKKEVKKTVKKDYFAMDRVGFAHKGDTAYKYYYTEVMQGKKGLKGVIEEMAPKAYIDLVGEDKIDAGRAASIVISVQQGKKMSIPYWDKAVKKGGDIDNVVAARELGLKKVPVLVCGG
jgi:hypothetical protein